MVSDDESELLEPPTIASNPFSIARSVVSLVNPARHTRFRAQRRPVTGAQQRNLPQEPTFNLLSDNPPITQRDPLGPNSPISREAEEDKDIGLHLRTPGPRSSISQLSDNSRNPRSRLETSFIY